MSTPIRGVLLIDRAPLLVSQWNHKRNPPQLIETIYASSKTKVWWICSKEHEWEAPVHNRVQNNTQCPYCTRKIPISGENDLAFLYPNLLAEWSVENSIDPTKVFPGSGKKALWVCEFHPHVPYPMSINSRVNEGRSCNCQNTVGNKTVISGVNDIATLYPELVPLWSEENKKRSSEVFGRSKQEFVWQCENLHQWKASALSLVAMKSSIKCPYCDNRKLLPDFNDIGTRYSFVNNEWDWEKNYPLMPSTFIGAEKDVVWWKCTNNHSWDTSIYYRVKQNHSCPICSGRRIQKGVNDLATLYPDMISQWHESNAKLPSEVTAFSSKKITWMCAKNSQHTWDTSVANRTFSGSDCPYCANKKAFPGENDLATLYPDIAAQWHEESNLPITPKDVTKGSSSVLFTWICHEKHLWKATVNDRVDGHGCLQCTLGQQSSAGEKELVDFLKSLGVKVLTNDKKLIHPFELDIVLPDKKIALEYNGLYWHSEARLANKHYHAQKTKLCQEKGYQLIHIWEDDWNTKKDVVLNSILHKINRSHQKTIGARKTFCDNISIDEARLFLNTHHIQGFSSGSFYFGLKEKLNKEVVAVMVLARTKNKQEFYLHRYATSQKVPGGFTKMLNAVVKEIHAKKIITFADLSISDGSLYYANGFSLDKILAPDYSYLYRNKRHHKFSFRIKNFKNNPHLKFEDHLTEKELADLNKLHRIWDCGKLRFIKTFA